MYPQPQIQYEALYHARNMAALSYEVSLQVS